MANVIIQMDYPPPPQSVRGDVRSDGAGGMGIRNRTARRRAARHPQGLNADGLSFISIHKHVFWDSSGYPARAKITPTRLFNIA